MPCKHSTTTGAAEVGASVVGGLDSTAVAPTDVTATSDVLGVVRGFAVASDRGMDEAAVVEGVVSAGGVEQAESASRPASATSVQACRVFMKADLRQYF